MKRASVFVAVILFVLQFCSSLRALPTTSYDAEMVVKGWLKVYPHPLESSIGRQIMSVETFTDEQDEPIYYVVYLQPSGFVIVSADDLVEPIIAFAGSGTYDPAPENPLGALVTQDLKLRIAAVRRTSVPMSVTPQAVFSDSQKKWSYLIGRAEISNDGFEQMGIAPVCDDNLSDLRVPPLVQSKWGQGNIYDSNDQPLACYNYCTPQIIINSVSFVEGEIDNYPCGCVAVAMAQFMRYQRYPQEPVEPKQFAFLVDGKDADDWLIRGDGPDGAYNWDDMIEVPDDNITDQQRRAIGVLCHDAAIAIETEFAPDGSSASLDNAVKAFLKTFQYSNAEWAENEGSYVDRKYFLSLINPNLDAGIPVILGFRVSEYPWMGHAALCDGYGYNMSILYHHLNMGWEGEHDCWYSLPDITVSDKVQYNTITQSVYNIFTDCTGEIISGRIIDVDGKSFVNVTVTAKSETGTSVHTTATNGKGIYAFIGLDSDTVYTITPDRMGYDFDLNLGYGPELNNVRTGRSGGESFISGNRWGVDFVGYRNSDPNSDGRESQVVCEDVKLIASDGSPDARFGCSVAMSGDYVIVGAYGDNGTGAAYIFKREGASWIEQAKLRKPFPRHSGDCFGFSVSISGDYAIVGLGSINSERKLSGAFSAYIFKRDGTSWTQQTELRSWNMESDDYFGNSVSISGNYAIVGSPYDNSDTIQRDKYDYGSVSIFEWDGISWVQQAKIFASDGSEFGCFGNLVSISEDYAVVTTGFRTDSAKSHNASVYILKRDGTSWMEQAKLTSPNVTMLNAFGGSISTDGNCVLIGAPEENNENGDGSGSVYVFECDGTNWTEQARLTTLDSAAFAKFGHSVLIKGDRIIVGAPEDDDNYKGRNSGSAYIFEKDGEDWKQRSKLTALDATFDDFFGTSVAIDGDYAVVGAPNDDDKGQDSGSVYVFKCISSIWTP
jgi:hypothetical protein